MLATSHLIYVVLLLLPLVSRGNADELSSPIPGEISQLYDGAVTFGQEVVYDYNFTEPMIGERGALRIFVVSEKADADNPVLVVVRHMRGVLSWRIPMFLQAGNTSDNENRNHFSAYRFSNRTLCPMSLYNVFEPKTHIGHKSNTSLLSGTGLIEFDKHDKYEHLSISLSTFSKQHTKYSMRVYVQDDYVVEMNETRIVTVSPSAPQYYQFQFPDDVDFVLIHAEAQDDLCMVLSVQDIKCPVADMDDSVGLDGIRQTMDRRAGLTISKEQFPAGLHIVFTVEPNDLECRYDNVPTGNNCHHGPCREKTVIFTITKKITKEEYLMATFGAFGMFVGSYLLAFIVSCVICVRQRRVPQERSLLEVESLSNNLTSMDRRLGRSYRSLSSCTDSSVENDDQEQSVNPPGQQVVRRLPAPSSATNRPTGSQARPSAGQTANNDEAGPSSSQQDRGAGGGGQTLLEGSETDGQSPLKTVDRLLITNADHDAVFNDGPPSVESAVKSAQIPENSCRDLVPVSNTLALPQDVEHALAERLPSHGDGFTSPAPLDPDGNISRRQHEAGITQGDISEESSIDEADIDMLRDADLDKDVFRTKTFLFVSDLSRKHHKVLSQKSMMYHWNLMTIGIFYGLPVVQLLATYQMVLHETGNDDLCYFNFLCAHPLGRLSDFNHVYSNIGYVMLGGLFIAFTWRREYLHKVLMRDNPRQAHFYGIPQHSGLFYAMGLALIIEGVMSGCYHICPNHSNFQFDTAFMYTIAILCMLKLYEFRHPDINANAYTAFGVLAFVIFLGVMGIIINSPTFWVFFTGCHLTTCIIVSLQIYYMGRWKVNLGIVKRIWQAVYHDLVSMWSGNWHALKPTYPARGLLLLIFNVANTGLSIFGILVVAPGDGDFGSFLLSIFISNLMMYLFYYILMKLRHGERICRQPLTYILLSITCGLPALYFFLNKSTTWNLKPAQSRHYNQECRLFHFYDNHDIWHFLSAGGLFFSFMVLLTLDDDLSEKPRDKIPVF